MANCKRIFRTLLLAAVLAAILAAGVLAADTAANPDEFYAAMERNLRAQEASFSIAYTGDRAALGLPRTAPLGTALRTMSARDADSADGADYPALNVEEGSMEWTDGAYQFHISYLATPEELDEVARRAAEIVDSLALRGEDDYTKLKLVYEYIGTHYVYDTTLTKFSAYDGLTTGSMVCQGYALLMYRVLWNAGVPCRIVTGVSQQENHAWNIARLDGTWYNLDITWDAVDELGGVMTWDYFLKSPADFQGHERFSPYETREYHAAHPMAKESRALPRVVVKSGEDAVTNLAVRIGVEVPLRAELQGAAGAAVQWSAEDPEIVRVTDDGLVTGQTLGSTILTAAVPGDRSVIAARIPTQAVDLRGVSPWAKETVTDYYLAQLLPIQLCGSFQQGLTRGELARLCYQYILRQRGWEAAVLQNPFTDIAGDPNALPILRCASVGLMRGVSEDRFDPDGPVTREQAAVVLMNLIAYLDGADARGPEHTAYADNASVSAWARSSVAAATSAGVLQGTDRGFRPQDPMTREQMVAALYRVYLPRQTQQPAAAA